ncbi:asparaginase [bacterium]|nr:asparaginase [bacterium]
MKKILLIHTGGTMGMTAGEHPSLATKQFEDEVFRHVPGVKNIAHIDFKNPFNIDSSNIGIRHWVEIGSIIEEHMETYDGFVIIHGTDTMSYTACALSFMLTNLPKPVILTGSQRPLSAIRTDAKNNLINAIELATYDIPEVGIFFDYKLFRGNRTIKISIDDFDAFSSPNYPLLAEVGLNIEIKNFHRTPTGIFRLHKNFSNDVFCTRLFPGFNPVTILSLIDSPIRVFIFEAFGSGNVPILENSLVPIIQKISGSGKLAAITSQCVNGSVDLALYDCGQQALEAGAITCGDMTTEAAIIKAMYLLGQFDGNAGKVKNNFNISIAGEITERSDP